jgi:hypothetical protein
MSEVLQENTTVLSDEDLSARERGSQGSVNLVDQLIGWHAFSGSSPFVIAGCRMHRTGGQERRL